MQYKSQDCMVTDMCRRLVVQQTYIFTQVFGILYAKYIVRWLCHAVYQINVLVAITF